MKHRYGYLRDLTDQRDYIYKPKLRLFYPKKVDLRKHCSKVENQMELGSCTGQALAGNMEFLDKKIDGAYVDVSRLFIYYNERKIEGTINEDSGAYIRDGIKSLKRWGVCEEKLLPYDISLFKQEPSPECYKQALNRRISVYQRIRDVSGMIACLAEGYPIVFGIAIYESFESDEVEKTGIVPMPGRYETMIGGHAVMAVGHDTKERRFIVRNSWGAEWGQSGYFTLPFKYVEKLGDDFWVIKKIKEKADEEDTNISISNRFIRWWRNIFCSR